MYAIILSLAQRSTNNWKMVYWDQNVHRPTRPKDSLDLAFAQDLQDSCRRLWLGFLLDLEDLTTSAGVFVGRT